MVSDPTGSSRVLEHLVPHELRLIEEEDRVDAVSSQASRRTDASCAEDVRPKWSKHGPAPRRWGSVIPAPHQFYALQRATSTVRAQRSGHALHGVEDAAAGAT